MAIEGGTEKPAGTTGNAGLESSLSELAKAIVALRSQPQPQTGRLPGAKFLVKALETLLPSVVMFALGYVFIQGVELDLKREQFTAATADKLKSYVEDLMLFEAETSMEELHATALALGGFGAVAVHPLLSIAEFGGEQRIDLASKGLVQAGRIAPERSCEIVAAVIDDTAAYSWQTRKAVASVAGLIGCNEAIDPLEQAKAQLADLGLDAAQRADYRRVLDEAIGRIATAQRRR